MTELEEKQSEAGQALLEPTSNLEGKIYEARSAEGTNLFNFLLFHLKSFDWNCFLDVKIAIIEPKDVQEPQEVQGAQIQGKKAPRDQWSKDIEFLLASIGYCVGVGNIWR